MKRKNTLRARANQKVKQTKQFMQNHYLQFIIYFLTVIVVILAIISQQNKVSVEKLVFK